MKEITVRLLLAAAVLMHDTAVSAERPLSKRN